MNHVMNDNKISAYSFKPFDMCYCSREAQWGAVQPLQWAGGRQRQHPGPKAVERFNIIYSPKRREPHCGDHHRCSREHGSGDDYCGAG
jgi:hypothetical protein